MKNKNIKFVLGFGSVLIILIYVLTKIFLIEIYDYLTKDISLVINLVKVSWSFIFQAMSLQYIKMI